jgi:hypothetical protein
VIRSLVTCTPTSSEFANTKDMCRCIPTTKQMLRRLRKDGALLDTTDVVVATYDSIDKDVDALVQQVEVVFDSDGEAREDVAGRKPTAGVTGVYVKDVMRRLITPELQTIRKLLPLQAPCRQGCSGHCACCG